MGKRGSISMHQQEIKTPGYVLDSRGVIQPVSYTHLTLPTKLEV